MKHKILYVIFFILLLFPFAVFGYDKTKITLSECVDGDTAKFIIDNEEKTVRFLAIDTEESKSKTKDNTYMGMLASYYTCMRLKFARTIELEYDPNATETDKYGRSLGWIFIDDKLLQSILIENGYAKVSYLYSDYIYTEELLKQEQEAKEIGIGIWNEDNIIEKLYNCIKTIIKIFT